MRESGSLVPTTARSASTPWRNRNSLAGRPTGVGGDCASFLNELLLLDQAAKILLVHQPACKRLNTALQLQQGEFRRHQFEHHRDGI